MFEPASKTFFHRKMLHCVAIDTNISAVLHLAHLNGIHDSLTHIALQTLLPTHSELEGTCSMFYAHPSGFEHMT